MAFQLDNQLCVEDLQVYIKFMYTGQLVINLSGQRIKSKAD
jgi:hypothetical protein